MNVSCPSVRQAACSFSSTTVPVWTKFRVMVLWNPGLLQINLIPKSSSPACSQVPLIPWSQAHWFDLDFVFLFCFFLACPFWWLVYKSV